MGAVLVFKVLSSMGSIALSLSPGPSMYRRYKAQDTDHFQLLPLLAMFGNYLLWAIYGLFVDDIFPLTVTTFICSMLGMFYVVVFLMSTQDKPKALKKCAVAAVLISLLVLYAVLAWAGATGQSNSDTGDVLGYLAVVSTLMFYLSPLAKIKTVLQTKSSATIPGATCAMGAVNNALWLTYGSLVGDMFIVVPNSVCCFFGVLQVLLYLKYDPRRLPQLKDDDSLAISIILSPSNVKAVIADSPSFRALVSPSVALSPIGLRQERVHGQRV